MGIIVVLAKSKKNPDRSVPGFDGLFRRASDAHKIRNLCLSTNLRGRSRFRAELRATLVVCRPGSWDYDDSKSESSPIRSGAEQAQTDSLADLSQTGLQAYS